MDPKLAYWTAALLNMTLLVGLAVRGVQQRRRGDIRAHARAMLGAVVLTLLFLVSYPVKLVYLGSEDMATWSTAAVVVLRLHESCILVMVVAGVMAGARALRLRHTRNVTLDPADAPAADGLARGHRRAGWTAVVAAGLAYLLAALVLAGMYRRSGIL